MPKSGLLQSGCISLYMTYLTWSAMSNSPYQECKPKSLADIVVPGGGNETTVAPPPGPPSDKDQASPFDAENIIGLVVWVLCVLYACMRTASNSQVIQPRFFFLLLFFRGLQLMESKRIANISCISYKSKYFFFH